MDTVRAVNEKGYDAVFAEQWKTELSECDIDPEAVSVDSEAHDMENGRDGLDGNAPEKDAPEKDNRKAALNMIRKLNESRDSIENAL